MTASRILTIHNWLINKARAHGGSLPPVDDDRTAALADAYSLLSSGTSALLSLERRRCAFHAQPVVLTEGENAAGCLFFVFF